jgi:hypothetical protein
MLIKHIAHIALCASYMFQNFSPLEFMNKLIMRLPYNPARDTCLRCCFGRQGSGKPPDSLCSGL